MVRHSRAEAAQPGAGGKWIDTAEGWARANVLYDKADRPPKAGSLKEALFLTVWLRRQEAEVYRMRVLAQGLADGTLEGRETKVPDAFKKYVEAVFPFTRGDQQEKDREMLERIKKEAEKGVITFSPQDLSPLKKRVVKRAELSDEARRALRGRKVLS